jgi:hypothetical protein
MRIAVAALVTMIVGLAAQPVHADPYRWCATYGAGFGSESCYFSTIEQCRASVSGLGGFCRENALYDGRPVGAPQGSGLRHHRN